MGKFFKASSDLIAGDLTGTIARHRAFPAICALWFAALFGIGMLVLPIGVVESLTVGTGLASIIPQAAPPLGTTARMLLALLAAGGGLLLGLWLARRVAAKIANEGETGGKREQADRTSRGRRTDWGAPVADPAAPKPISAREELGSLSLDEPVDGEPFRAPLAEPVTRHEQDDADESFGGPAFLAQETAQADVAEPIMEQPVLAEQVTKSVELDSYPELEEPGADWLQDVTGDEDVGTEALAERVSEDIADIAEPIQPEADIDGELAQLTLAQLIERFSRSLQAREQARNEAAAAEVAQAAPAAIPETIEATRPSLDLGPDFGSGAPRYNPFSDYGDVDASEPAYASLLTVPDRASKAVPEPASEPVAIFPAREEPRKQASIPEPEEGEDSLREALRKLQMLSKTA